MGDLFGFLVTMLPWILMIVLGVVTVSSLLRIADALEEIAEALQSDETDDDNEEKSTEDPG
jgi:hypothetical protein